MVRGHHLRDLAIEADEFADGGDVRSVLAITNFRAIATCYDTRAVNFLAGIYAASIAIWLS